MSIALRSAGLLLGGVLLAVAGADQPANLDRYGDPLPERAIARLGTARFRLGGSVTALAFSPDGKRLAVSSHGDNMLFVWDWPSGKVLLRFASRSTALKFSPDGTRLASVSGNKALQVWDLESGNRLLALPTGQETLGGPGALDFGANGKQVLVSRGAAVQVWDIESKQLARTFEAEGRVRAFALQPDNKHLALTHELKAVTLWDLVAAKKLHVIPVGEQRGSPAAIAPSGRVFAYEVAPTVIALADTVTGKELHRLAGHKEAIDSLLFTPDSKTLLSGSWDNTLRLWDVGTGNERVRIPANSGIPFGVLSPDGKTVVTGGTGSPHAALLWDATTGLPAMNEFPGNTSPLSSLAISPDGMLTATCSAVGGEATIWLWETTTGKPVRQFAGHPRGTLRVTFAPDGKTLASTGISGTTAKVWEVATGREVLSLSKHRGTVGDVAYSPDGKALATVASYSGSTSEWLHQVKLWNAASGEVLSEWPDTARTVRFLSGTGTLLVFHKDRIQFWDIAGKRERESWAVAPQGLVALSPDGQVAVATRLRDPDYLWELATGRQIASLPSGLGSAVAFAPDARYLAVAANGRVRLYDWALEEDVATLHGHRGEVTSLEFTPDGTHLVSAAAGETSAIVWDLKGLLPRALPPLAKLEPAVLDHLCAQLGSDEPEVAYRAIWTLARAQDQAVPRLRTIVQPMARAEPARIERLVRDLDAEDFEVRQNASTELERIGDSAGDALRKVLRGQPSAEQRRRVGELLKKLGGPVSRERVRGLRTVGVLERIGSALAQELLKELADKHPDANLARDARAALFRLASRLPE
jgi:WD40 repeat protein